MSTRRKTPLQLLRETEAKMQRLRAQVSEDTRRCRNKLAIATGAYAAKAMCEGREVTWEGLAASLAGHERDYILARTAIIPDDWQPLASILAAPPQRGTLTDMLHPQEGSDED